MINPGSDNNNRQVICGSRPGPNSFKKQTRKHPPGIRRAPSPLPSPMQGRRGRVRGRRGRTGASKCAAGGSCFFCVCVLLLTYVGALKARGHGAIIDPHGGAIIENNPWRQDPEILQEPLFCGEPSWHRRQTTIVESTSFCVSHGQLNMPSESEGSMITYRK